MKKEEDNIYINFGLIQSQYNGKLRAEILDNADGSHSYLFHQKEKHIGEPLNLD